MMVGVAQSIRQKATLKVEKLKRDRDYLLADWDKVEKIAGPDHLVNHVLSTTKKYKILTKSMASSCELLDYYRMDSPCVVDSERETRRRYIGVLRGNYWHQFEAG